MRLMFLVSLFLRPMRPLTSLQSLKKIHAEGYLHGDLDALHMLVSNDKVRWMSMVCELWSRKGAGSVCRAELGWTADHGRDPDARTQVFFVDFGSSMKASDVADFQAMCSAELAALHAVFARD